MALVSHSDKAADPQTCNFIKKRPEQKRSPLNIAKPPRTRFLNRTGSCDN